MSLAAVYKGFVRNHENGRNKRLMTARGRRSYRLSGFGETAFSNTDKRYKSMACNALTFFRPVRIMNSLATSGPVQLNQEL